MRVWQLGVIVVAITAPAAHAHAKGADATAAITKLVHAQIDGMQPMAEDDGVPADVYLDDAQLSTVGNSDLGKVGPGQLPDAVIGPCFPKERELKQLRVQPAADGKSAVVSFIATFNSKCDVSGELFYMSMRVSEVAVQTADGWRIAGGAWSVGEPNGNINKAAQAGKLSALDPVAADDGGDAGLRAAFASLLAGTGTIAGEKRKELIAIGSADGELTTSGPAFARAWHAAWVGHAVAKGHVRAELAPSGTTGWVTADVELTKTKGAVTYTIPFRLFVVFDHGADGWSVLHAQFAVPSP